MAQVAENAVVRLSQPGEARTVTVPITENFMRLSLEFEPDPSAVAKNGQDLEFYFEDGGTLVLQGFYDHFESQTLPVLVTDDGDELAGEDFLASLREDLLTAAGPAAGPASNRDGAGEYSDDAGSLIDGINRLGKLGTIYWGRQTEIPEQALGDRLAAAGASGPGDPDPVDPIDPVDPVDPVPHLPPPSVTVTIDVVTETEIEGSGDGVRLYSGVFEDAQPNQHTGNQTYDYGKLEVAITPEGNTVVDELHMRGFEEGTTIYLGDPADPDTQVIVITGPDEVLSLTPDQLEEGVYLKPPTDSDRDMDITVELDIRNPDSGETARVPGPDFTIVVDAAADKPLYVEQEVRIIGNEDLALTDVTETDNRFENGYNKITELIYAGGESNTGPVVVEIDVTAAFSDFTDGSERHFVLVEVRDDLIPNQEMGEIIEYNGVQYYRVEVDNHDIDPATGEITLTFGFTTRDAITTDTTFSIKTGALAIEDPSDGEITLANNEAWTFTDMDGVATVLVDVVNSELRIDFGWASESNNNAKHTDGAYQPDYGKMGVDADSTSEHGAPIRISIADTNGKDDSDDFITRVVLSPRDGAKGEFVDMYGQPITEGSGHVDEAGNVYTISIRPDGSLVIEIDSSGAEPGAKPVDLDSLPGGLFFQPDSSQYSDAEIAIDFQVVVENEQGAQGVFTGTGIIVLDAVADAPEYTVEHHDEITFIPYQGGEFEVSAKTEFADGFATQTLGGGLFNAEGSTSITLSNVKFSDYSDGSESHFVLVGTDGIADWAPDVSRFGEPGYECFEKVEGELETVWLDANNNVVEAGTPGATMYYKLPISNEYLESVDGEIGSMEIPIHIGPNTEIGNYTVDVKLGAEEHPTGSNREYDLDNNIAIVDGGSVDIEVLTFQSTVTVKAGWAYESAATVGSEDNPNADPEAWGVADGLTDGYRYGSEAGAPVEGSAARITIQIPEPVANEEFGEYITIKFAGGGHIYDQNGRMDTVDLEDGMSLVRIRIADVLNDGGELTFYFVPDASSDSDADIVLTYEFTVNCPDIGREFTVTNQLPIVIDAVADAAVVEEVKAAEDSFSDLGFSVHYEAVFHHDDSETQYIIISNPDGLLSLGDLGDLAKYLSVATLAELLAYDNPDPNAVKYFDSLNEGDIILRIDDLAALDLLDNSADGKLSIDIPLVLDRDNTGEDIDINVTTAVVEGGGNNPANWSGEEGSPGEYDFSNNIAITEEGVTVRLAEGNFVVKEAVDPVYEGDKSEQNLYGAAADSDDGTVLQLKLEDSQEAVTEIYFTCRGADGSEAEGAVSFTYMPGGVTEIPPGGGLVLTADLGGVQGNIAYYSKVQVVDADGTVLKEYTISPAMTLDNLTSGRGEGQGLRFTPAESSDSDADVIVDFTATVKDLGSGDTITKTESITIERDAVADLPVGAESAINPQNEGYASIALGEPFTTEVKVTFGDYQDGSESHYIFVSKEYLASLNIPDHLKGSFAILSDADAARVCAQVDGQPGIPGASADGYYVIEVSADYLQANDGQVNLSLEGTLNEGNLPPEGESATLGITAVAVEYEGYLTETGVNRNSDGTSNVEVDNTNNVAVADASQDFTWAKVDNDFNLVVGGPAYEGDQPDQYKGDDRPEGGAELRITTGDASEVFTELTVTYQGTDGEDAHGLVVLTVGGQTLEIPSGTTLVFTYDPANPTSCIKVSYSDENGVTQSVDVPGLSLEELTAQGLRYVPTVGDDSDMDVRITMTGKTLETESGETGTHTMEATVIVDAVADKPLDVSWDVTPQGDGATAVSLQGSFTVNVEATFGDYLDGSEAHYLFVSREYLESIGIPADLAESFEILSAEQAAVICSQVNGTPGIPGATVDGYFVIRVSNDYLKDHDGKVELPLEAALKSEAELTEAGIREGDEMDLGITAVAVEHQGYDTRTGENLDDRPGVDNQDYAAGQDVKGNNVAVTDASGKVTYAVLDNKFDIKVDGHAYENDQHNQHLGTDERHGGAKLTITPQDESEVFDTLTISYIGEDGNEACGSVNLTVNGQYLDIPSGTELVFTYDANNPTLCIKVGYTDADGNSHSVDVQPGMTLADLTQGLRYTPDPTGNDSDVDVLVTLGGTTRETETGETGRFEEVTVQVIVDAVADKPMGEKSEYDYSQYGRQPDLDEDGNQRVDENGDPLYKDEPLYSAINDGSPVSFGVQASFRDYSDGSESHYIFINARYLQDGSVKLIDPATGEEFEGGAFITDPVRLAEIMSQVHGDPGVIPQEGDVYLVFEVDPTYLQGSEGEVSLTVEGTLKEYDDIKDLGAEKTDLSFDVKAVAVEHEGYDTEVDRTGTAGNDEWSNTNNVAVTDIGSSFQYASLDNEFSVSADSTYEGNQDLQHKGDYDHLHGGAAITLKTGDATEVITRMTLTYEDGHGGVILHGYNADGELYNPDGSYANSMTIPSGVAIVFEFSQDDPTLIIRVSWKTGEHQFDVMDVYDEDGNRGMHLEDLTSLGLRYVPDTGDNSDADVLISIDADILETASGAEGQTHLETTVIVDAVADKPVGERALVNDDGRKSADVVIVNEETGQTAIKVQITATFGDYEDGSESHYIFVSREYLQSIKGFPNGITLLGDADAATVLSNAGLSGDPGYFVLEVSADYLQDGANNGTVNFTLEAELDLAALPDEEAQEEAMHVEIYAGAIEHEGLNTKVDQDLGKDHGKDLEAENNVALKDLSVDIRYAALDGDFDLSADTAYEGDMPDQYIPEYGEAGGSKITFAPKDPSEVVDTMSITYDDSEGMVTFSIMTENGAVVLELPSGSTLDFGYRNEGAGATLCNSVKVTYPDGSTEEYDIVESTMADMTKDGQLRYTPDTDSQSDNDVAITFEGTIRETETNESGDFKVSLTVEVDAVADSPDLAIGIGGVETGYEAVKADKPLEVTIQANFGKDTVDGSEAHYLFISREYLESLDIPADMAAYLTILGDDAAAMICAQVDGANGIPGASADGYFVIQVSNDYLTSHGGDLSLTLSGNLKDMPEREGETLSLEVKGVAVEHQGYLTETGKDLGGDHGVDTHNHNNVSVTDASEDFTFAKLNSDQITAEATAGHEGDQPLQHAGDWETLEGGSVITLAPKDGSERFDSLTFDYDNEHGSLTLVVNGVAYEIAPGATVEFQYSAHDSTECIGVKITDANGSQSLDFRDADGKGMSLTDLTSKHLRYLPDEGDNSDADVKVDFSGTMTETASGESGPVDGSFTVVIDAVADKPMDTSSEAFIGDGESSLAAIKPGGEFSLNLKATFKDYGENDPADTSEGHYLCISKEHLASLDLDNLPQGITLLTGDDLSTLMANIATQGGSGIHGGEDAAGQYWVLVVSPEYLQANDGTVDIKIPATVNGGDEALGEHTIEVKAVAVEHDGYQTKVGEDLGGGHGQETSAENNVAVSDADCTITVRDFIPEQVGIAVDSDWVFENDRSEGHLNHYEAGSEEGRDNGVALIFTGGPGEGNVVHSITLEYPMPSNGSPNHHLIESSEDVTITYQVTGEGTVIVTVTANEPNGSVGELRFIPGDNYDNADVTITVNDVVVADPALGVNTATDPQENWGNGVAEGGESVLVKVDAVAQAPGLEIDGVCHDEAVVAGMQISITGKVCFEDIADGSEEHFLMMEIRDGYYPDKVVLTINGKQVEIELQHYNGQSDPVQEANYALQELVTSDDGESHLFVKISVEDALQYLNTGNADRLDGIEVEIVYQTRDWAEEGVGLHFAAVSTEDVNHVIEYDANFNLINDELPFDKRLEDAGITVDHANNTAITIDASPVYVYWDSEDPNDVTFDPEYVFENDRPDDHLGIQDREYGTGMELKIPDGAVQVTINPTTGYPEGSGSFYFLPQEVWEDFVASGGDDADLAQYLVTYGETKGQVDGQEGPYTLVFIPSNESCGDGHEDEGAHHDVDVHFDYVILTEQYGEDGEVLGHKRYTGKDEVIRVDAVANQAEIIGTETDNGDDFSLTGAEGTTNSFDLTVRFHDLDGTEDHYILVEVVPNFEFHCNGYVYQPGDSDSLYQDVTQNEDGSYTTTWYYKVPVSLDQINDDGTVTVRVSYEAYEGTPRDADYPTADSFSYGAMTEDKTSSRWDSYNPKDANYINRDGADGEYTWDNNTSVTWGEGVGTTTTGTTTTGTSSTGTSSTGTSSTGTSSTGTSSTGTSSTGTSSTGTSSTGTSSTGTSSTGTSSTGTSSTGTSSTGTSSTGTSSTGTSSTGTSSTGTSSTGTSSTGTSSTGTSSTGTSSTGTSSTGTSSTGTSSTGTSSTGTSSTGTSSTGTSSTGTSSTGTSSTGTSSTGTSSTGTTTTGTTTTGTTTTGTTTTGTTTTGTTTTGTTTTSGQGLHIGWVYENSTPQGNVAAGAYDNITPTEVQVEGPEGGATLIITVPAAPGSLVVDADGNHTGEVSDDGGTHARGSFVATNADGTPYDGLTAVENPDGSVTYTIATVDGSLPDGVTLEFIAAPDCNDADITLEVTWKDGADQELSTGELDVYVDAVAQWAEYQLDSEDGVYGVTGKDPQSLLEVTVKVNFLDQDGSEANYVVVEKVPGIVLLRPTGEVDADGDPVYAQVKEVYLNGKTYYAVEATPEELASGEVKLEFSVNADLTSPLYQQSIEYNDGTYTGIKLNTGTMTIDGAVGGPDNWEYTLSNNTALNIQEESLTIVISSVNAEGGNATIMVKETGAPEDNLVQLDPNNPDTALNLSMDGDDKLTSLEFTDISGNGGVYWMDDEGALHKVEPGQNVAELYLEGRLYYMQDRYEDADARLDWKATVQDGLSVGDTAEVSGTTVIAVDAVALASEIHLTCPVLDEENNTLSLTLSFDDHQSNEIHYAVIAPDLYRQIGDYAIVIGPDGTEHPVQVETIFDPDGNPYYAVRVDDYTDENGQVTVRFEVNGPADAPTPLLTGGVSVEPNVGYYEGDREWDLTDNWAINTRWDHPTDLLVTTRDLAFDIGRVVEDSEDGTAIVLGGAIGVNDQIDSATLTFTPQDGTEAFAGAEGDQIATIVYNGECFAVVLDADGKAVCEVTFTGGFDPSADFRIIWGTAHMEDGVLVVDSWNHAASGSLDLNTVFTVSNVNSGTSKEIDGADPDGVQLWGTADAAEDVSGRISAVAGEDADGDTPVGAGADSVTVTLTGHFADVDGSEQHYLMVEVPAGWTVLSEDAEKFVHNGTTYYRVAVDGTETDPTAEITLLPPDGTDREISLKTGALSVEDNGDSAFTQGDALTVNVSYINATDIDVTAQAIYEDGLFSLVAIGEASLVNGDANDTLSSITFTDLAGGTIVDADGNVVDQLTFTKEELLSGQYFYKPKENYAGEVDSLGHAKPIPLTYDVVLGETNTGATDTSLVNRTLNIKVIPVADAPVDVQTDARAVDMDSLSEAAVGHKATITANLTATYSDIDGSEEHFFIVSVPVGITVKDGAGYTVEPLTAEDLAALGDRFPDGATLYKVVVSDSTQADVSLDLTLEVVSTDYNGGDIQVVGGSSELLDDGSHSYGFSDAETIELPDGLAGQNFNHDPDAEASGAEMDTWRDEDKMTEGQVRLDVDPDGDTVNVSGVKHGDTEGSLQTYVSHADDPYNGQDCYVVKGQYGTLYLFQDGSYRYQLDPGMDGTEGTETFEYSLADTYGGSGANTITIDLKAPNDAPWTTSGTSSVDSVRGDEAIGSIKYGDADGDAVTISINGQTMTNVGTEENPVYAIRVEGKYGVLWLYENGNFRYTLNEDGKGSIEEEVFTYVVRDEFGLETSNTITIDLYNTNTDPTASAGQASIDTLRDADGEVAGSVAFHDNEGDTVVVDSASGPKGEGALGLDDQGNSAFVVEGEHGTLYLYADGSYRYVLSETGVSGEEVFTFTVTDGFLGSGGNTITISLDNSNEAPVIEGDFAQTLDTLRTEDGVVEGSISFHDPDWNQDLGRYDLAEISGISSSKGDAVSDGQGGFTVRGEYGTFHIDKDGNYTYQLDSDAGRSSGQETFTVTVTDEFGKTTSQEIVVDLQNHNIDPTAEDAASTLDSWRQLTVDGQVTMDDADGDTPTVSWLQGATEMLIGDKLALVATGKYGTLYMYEDGSYTYEFTGPGGKADTDVFTIGVSDGYGGSAEATITVTLTGDNEAPIAGSSSQSLDTHANTEITGQVVFYDNDYYMDGDTKVYDDVYLTGLSGPKGGSGTTVTENGRNGLAIEGEHGTLYLFEDGTYRYELTDRTPGLTGTETFTYQVEDAFGGKNNATVTIDLVSINHDPTAQAAQDSLDTWREGTVVQGNLVLGDADGDEVSVTAGLGINGPGVPGADDEGNSAIIVQGEHGTLYLYADGAYRYVLTDPAGTGGQETFNFTVEDGYGGKAENSITINLTNANTAPEISGDLDNTVKGNLEDYANGVVQVSGDIDWIDAEGDAIASVTVNGVALPGSGYITVEGDFGTLRVDADGSYTYTLRPGLDAEGITGSDVFTIVATDEFGASSSTDLTVNLEPLGHAPECADLNVNWEYTSNGEALTRIGGELVFTDADLNYNDQEALQLWVNGTRIDEDGTVVEGQYGILTINQDGTFTYVPKDGCLDQPLLEEFTYTVTDTDGNATDANLYIRLSDDAEPFPNTGSTEAGVVETGAAEADVAGAGAAEGDGLLSGLGEDLFGSGEGVLFSGASSENLPWSDFGDGRTDQVLDFSLDSQDRLLFDDMLSATGTFDQDRGLLTLEVSTESGATQIAEVNFVNDSGYSQFVSDFENAENSEAQALIVKQLIENITGS